MAKTVSAIGHLWQREFFYTTGSGANAKFHRCLLPGGAGLMEALLGEEAVPAPDPGLMLEHLELGGFSAAKEPARLYVARHAGYTHGERVRNACPGKAAVVWDEGWGDLEIPARIPVLYASNRVLPSAEAMQVLSGRSMVLLDADVLRGCGAMISKQVSWERTATDLVWQLKNNPALAHLAAADHLVIAFAEDALVYLVRKDNACTALLTLSHGGAEGTLRAQAQGGLLPDAWAALVLGCARQFTAVLEGEAFDAHAVLAPACALWKKGYDTHLLEQAVAFQPDEGYTASAVSFPVPCGDGTQGSDPDFWCISHNFQGGTLYDLAHATVLEGLGRLDGLPRMQFGALTTVDRREIESYQNVKNLITSYAASESVRPLSIAVFGAPGSGKSFGVTQIAKNVLPGKAVKVEFNVSQFTSPADLTSAFHQIRDVVLAGKLPLVFFDEFDSDRDGLPLGWLKSFLMPMQDGKFKDGAEEHPVGKCIFVFAGGTAASFEAFTAPLRDAALLEPFRNAKGPDFVSRLRGTINVLGPNPVDETEQNFILRRALLLRSLCERKFNTKGGSFIDENVLRAMLLVPKYKHGARSMESILDMSRVEGGVWEPASLPFRAQLALHVDEDAFVRLVLREVTLASYTEQLAKAIHERYRKIAIENPRSEAPELAAWEDLDPTYRAANIRQARSIEKKLRAVGCSYDAGDTPYPTVESFSSAEIDLLSRLEHDLWMAERLGAGWKFGKQKSAEQRTSPYLVPWEELSDDIKKLDRDTVENIIPLLHSIGLRVYRTV